VKCPKWEIFPFGRRTKKDWRKATGQKRLWTWQGNSKLIVKNGKRFQDLQEIALSWPNQIFMQTSQALSTNRTT